MTHPLAIHGPAQTAPGRKIFAALLVFAVLCLRFQDVPVVHSSSWGPTLLVNTEAFQTIDDTDTTSNIVLRFGDTVNKQILWDRSASNFRIGDSVEIIGTASGRVLHAQDQLRSSGSLVVRGGVTLNSFANCTALETSNGVLGCGTDDVGGGGGAFTGTGALQSAFDARYVNQSGDTMTGSLTVKNNGGLNASGSILTNSSITLNSDNEAADAVLTFGNATAAQTLRFLNARQLFSFSTGVNIAGTASGRILHAQNRLASSGSLVVRSGSGSAPALSINGAQRVGVRTPREPKATFEVIGSMSGSAIFIGSMTDCDTESTSKVLWDMATGKFSCGTDQTGAAAGASIARIAGNSGAAGSDITWQNLTSNSATCNTVALCASIMTTTGVGAGTWKFKYTLIYQTAATTTGIAFGINHTGTAGEFQAMWYNATTGGAAATGIGDNDTTTVAGQLMEAKHDSGLNAVIGSASAGVATANADVLAVLEGIIVVTGSGNLELKIASEVASSNVLVKADSMLELLKIE